MSSHTHQSTDADDAPFACPNCPDRPPLRSRRCEQCGYELTEQDGILTPDPGPGDRPPRDGGTEQLDSLAVEVERSPIRDAARAFTSIHGRTKPLDELFDVRRESWLALVADRIGGRCLHVDAGAGRRSMVLAELTETVYAVEPDRIRARILEGRDDYERADRVVAVNAPTDQLPFTDGAFETIVAQLPDASGRSNRRYLERLTELLADDGVLLVTVPGPTAPFVISPGNDAASSTLRERLRAGTPPGIRAVGRDLGIGRTAVYALLPSVDRPHYTLDPTSEDAVAQLTSMVAGDGLASGTLGGTFVAGLQRSGLLERAFPGYLAVFDAAGASPTTPWADPLVVAGRARSVVLDVDPDGVGHIWKVPNRRAHQPLTERENEVLSTIVERSPPLASTLPTGRAVTTPVGTGRREESVPGRPLQRDLESDLESFRRVLELGLDWLARFQTTVGVESVALSPAEVRSALQFDPAGVEPPPIDEPVESVQTTVHGDFIPQNVYVDGDSVTAVIDWEYAAVAGSAVIDAGLLVLNAAHQCFDGFEAGYRTVLCGESDHTVVARALVRDYCDRIGLPYRSFDRLLPLTYLHRLRLDWECDAVSTYTTKMDDRARLAALMIETPPGFARRSQDGDRQGDRESDRTEGVPAPDDTERAGTSSHRLDRGATGTEADR